MFKRGTKCPHCGTPYSEAFIAKAEKAKSEALRESYRIKKAYGEPIGRPREIDYDKVRALRSNGLSIRKIAAQLGCSPWSVQVVLKK